MPDRVVGRERELELASAFLAGLRHGPEALIFVGEAGIGKTTVWEEAVRRRPTELRLLSVRPVEAESHLGFAALGDLFEPVLDDVLSQLPLPQCHALAVALLREDPGPRRLDQRAVAAATLSVLRALAVSGPVLVAIDDVQRLDWPSARALAFATRRMGELPLIVLGTERPRDDCIARLDLARALPPGRCTRVVIGPLIDTAIHQVLKDQCSRPLARRTLVRIKHAAAGNPLFCLELARSISDDTASEAPWILSENLRTVVEARLAKLPPRAREALLIAAALGSPPIDLVASAVGGERAASVRALERAAAAGVVTSQEGRIRFNHPLYAAGVYSSASPSKRRLMHRRLATLVSETEARARHLALGAEAPDERVAAMVAVAAEHARNRGAPEVAAELAEHARVLTPSDRLATRQRRSIQAAEYHFHAGELRRARDVLEALLTHASTGTARADALRLLGEIRYHENSIPEAVVLLKEALTHVGDDVEVRLATDLNLTYGAMSMGDFEGAGSHASRALVLAEHIEEPALLAQALGVKAMADFLLGRGLDEASVARALRLEDPRRQVPVMLRPSLVAGLVALYMGHLARCEQLLAGLRHRIIVGGEECELPFVCGYLTWSACWRGDLSAAAAFASESIESATLLQSDVLRCLALSYAAAPPAYAGDVALARGRIDECLALAATTGYSLGVLWASWGSAVLALSQDDPEGADRALRPLCAPFEVQGGVPEPIRAFFLPDEIEALIALGRLDEADRLLDLFDDAARRLGRPWALMRADRCRALLLAARGDLDGASAVARRAAATYANLELRLEVARTFLTAGQIERRRRSKRVAAGFLRQALDLFEQCGARLWAARARADINRLGLRTAAPAQLTVSEERVARLVAQGMTNRDVAARLFISPKTVESNLARVYGKLGIRSRAELGGRLTR